MHDENVILVVGASARQLAQSARLANRRVIGIDLFADWDLRQVADCHPVQSLNEVRLDAMFPTEQVAGFVICGGMETRFEVLVQLESKIRFYGPKIRQLKRSQDPLLLSQVCADNQIRFPEVRSADSMPNVTNAEWLLKPRLGSGGHLISRPSPSSNTNVNGDLFWQRFVEGKSFSALLASNGGAVQLLGVTEQLVGDPKLTSSEFAYCGSIGPVIPNAELREQLLRCGSCLANEFELIGCFGIDMIVDHLGQSWLIEINPRITASAEIFELAGSINSAMELHLNCFQADPLPAPRTTDIRLGKAIVYSNYESNYKVSCDMFEWMKDRSLQATSVGFAGGRQKKYWPEKADEFLIADIPEPGTVIKHGHPIATVLCFDRFSNPSSGKSLHERLCQAADSIRNKILQESKKLADSSPASF